MNTPRHAKTYTFGLRILSTVAILAVAIQKIIFAYMPAPGWFIIG